MSKDGHQWNDQSAFRKGAGIDSFFGLNWNVRSTAAWKIESTAFGPASIYQYGQPPLPTYCSQLPYYYPRQTDIPTHHSH